MEGVDVRVTSDGPQGDVRHPAVDEALFDVVGGRVLRENPSSDLGFLLQPFGAASQQVIRTDAKISDAVSWNERGGMPSVWRSQMHHLFLRPS
jgi:hypothetical protein